MNTTIEQTTEAPAAEDAGWEWAIVEIFGHRRHAGRVREEERFGAKMLRLDIPKLVNGSEPGWTTHYYGGASLFSFTLTDEATVMKANKPYEPVGRYIAPPDTDADAPEVDDDPDLPF